MDGEQRREKLLELLECSDKPLSGSALAALLGVSRQVIVQDIALLRAGNRDILSTARGYTLYTPPQKHYHRCFMVNHTDEQTEDELNTILFTVPSLQICSCPADRMLLILSVKPENSFPDH